MAKKKKAQPKSPEKKLEIGTLMNIIQTIIIGFVGLFLTIQSNQIADTQLRLSMAQNVPQIRVNLRQVYNDEIKYVDTHDIEISCEEGFFTNYRSYAVSFLNISGLRDSDIRIPLHGYWAVHSLTGNTNGTIETVLGLGNQLKIKDVCEQIRQLTDEVVVFDVETYLRISYIDVLGEKQSRYYYVQPIRGTTVMDAELCETNIQDFDESYFNDNHINLDTWSKEDLEKLITLYTTQSIDNQS